MRSSLAAGLAKTATITVDQPRTIDFMGEECRVYATPQMLNDIEVLCRDLLLEHLDPGENSVGARVELDHLAPTLLGMTVEITAKVAEVNGRLVTFEIEARDSLDLVGRGAHMRFLVDTAKIAERLRRKAAKVKEAGR
jgi:predicted thioesterase